MKEFLEKFKKQTTRGTQILTVLAILAAVNFLSYQLFIRFDLTQNKVYSISQSSKEVIKNLDDVVSVTAYFSKNLPPQYAGVRQEVGDVLAEYQSYAKSKLRVEFVDPGDDEKLQQELQLLGVPRLQFNVLQNDKYEVTNGYLGIVARYGDERQAIPVVSDTQNLEYQITSAITKITAENVPVVGFATGNGEYSRAAEMTLFSQKLSEIYALRDVDLSAGETVAEDIGTLIIAGPKTPLSERAQYALDQFIMRGGSVIFLVEGVAVDDNLLAQPNEDGLDNLLNAYGFSVAREFVLDTQNDRASFNQGFLKFTTPYPFFVRVTETGFNAKNAAVAKLQNVVFPWASPLTISSGASGSAAALAWTTPAAWLMRENFNLNPQSDFGFTPNGAVYSLAAVRSGELASAFGESAPAGAAAAANGHIARTASGKVVVFGNAKFITDGFIQPYPDNLTLLQNIVDFTSLDSNLITIRSKIISARPLEEISDARRKNIKYFNIFGVTAVVLGFGIFRYYSRKRSRFADEL